MTTEELARKFLESLPPDGHLEPGCPAWTVESVVRAFVAGAESAGGTLVSFPTIAALQANNPRKRKAAD